MRTVRNSVVKWPETGATNEPQPDAGLLPEDRAARAHCRAISGEMHSGFSNLRSTLPMNLRAHYPAFQLWARVQADIDRVVAIWRECLASYGGPFLFGTKPTTRCMHRCARASSPMT